MDHPKRIRRSDQSNIDLLTLHGGSKLSNEVLLSIVLGIEEQAAKELISSFGTISKVLEADVDNLCKQGKLSKFASASLVASKELFSRIEQQIPDIKVIRSNADVQSIFGPLLSKLNHEEVWVLYLTGSNHIIERCRISSGTTTSSPIDIKLIINKAIQHLASSIILVHNHPSGNSEPGKEDITSTEQAKAACNLLEINLLDHIIITKTSSFSFKEKKLL